MRVIFIALIAAIYSINVQSQIIKPVSWAFSVKQLPNNEAELIFQAKVEPNWHMYSQFFEEGGPVKMTFAFEDSKNYKRIGKVIEVTKPHKEHDDIFDIDVQYFDGQATLKQKIKIISTKNFTVKGEVNGQACSDIDGSCVLLDPEFEFSVKGAAQEKVKKE